MGSQNVIMGDDTSFGTDMPQTRTPEAAFAELLKSAKFSKTAEFKELKKYLEQKIEFYKAYLPDGRPVGTIPLPFDEMAKMWIAANVIIGEFQAIIGVYEGAAQQVKDATAKQKRT